MAFIFAGQGAQKPGMGHSLYEGSAAAREIFERAENIRPGMKKLCFEGPAEELNETVNTQPALFTAEAAAFAALAEAGVRPELTAGFSAGEYGALHAAGALDFEPCLRLIMARAEHMQRAASVHPGSMLALIGGTAEDALELCRDAEEAGVILPVNYNCPGQTVVAGENPAIERAEDLAKERRLRAVRLAVSGAFHSPLMVEAAKAFKADLAAAAFEAPKIPIVSNVTAQPMGRADFAALEAAQVKSPVRWEESVRTLMELGADAFVEVGPGKTLAGFLKRIDRHLPVWGTEDMGGVAAAAAALKGGA
nr:ACP S-malonyltransferase [Gehongia tenuis]